jgi:hypothetical protein
MVRLLCFFASLGLLVTACTEPETAGRVNATIDGLVYITGPVAGARVSAYAWDLKTGERGELLAQSEATSETGAFHVELGNYAGPILLVARGIGATFVEPASGTVTWDSQTELRGTYATWDKTGELTFEVPSGEALADVMVSPWSDLALSYTDGRFVSKRSLSYRAAAGRAFGLLRDHLELDYFAVVPTSLGAEGATSWNANAQAGLVLAGLSDWVRRAAFDSHLSAAGLTSLQLLELLRRDLSDSKAQLDGQDVAGTIAAAACSSVCTLSGKTLRAHFAEAMATFLGSTANHSPLTVSDAADFLRRVSSRRGELWAEEGSENFDTTPPTLAAPNLQAADIVSGTKVATVVATDNFKMGTVVVSLLRQDQPITDSEILGTTVATEGDQKRVVTLTIHSDKLSDGPVSLHVEAQDEAGNEATPLDIPLFFDNAPAARLSGAATAGGPLVGARIQVFEYDNATRGRLLGETTTDETGLYSVTLDDSTQSVLLLRAETPPAQDSAYYIETANGYRVTLGASDAIESIVTGHRNGTDRSDGILSPWTHVGAAYARAAFKYLGQNWPQTVDQAFAAWELHFAEGGTSIAVRSVNPANLTIPEQGTTLTIQARYGLTLAALGQLADVLAKDTGATVASVNTLKLTQVLASDVGDELGAPVLNGRGIALLDINGASVTSYLTRLQLASAAASFLRNNVNNRSALRELDVRTLLDRISTDDGARGATWPALYPASEVPKPYDTQPPAAIQFPDPTPPDGRVLRGALSLRAESYDTRALASFKWIEPTGKLTSVLLDTSAGKDGVWVLSGELNTDLFGEGGLRLVARAQDEAGLTTDGERTFVVDRTPPNIRIDNASQKDPTTLATLSLADGGWTRLDALSAFGAVTDLHIDSARASWNGGTPLPLALRDQGDWSLPDLVLREGANTLTVDAMDQAGNPSAMNATYYRDTVDPIVTIIEAIAGVAVVPPQGWTNQKTIKIRGTIEDATFRSASYQWNPTDVSMRAPLSVPAPPNWDLDLSLLDGANVLSVLGTDKAGNDAEATVTYYRDGALPVITIDKALATTASASFEVAPGTWSAATSFAIEGSLTEPNLLSATYSWNGGPATSLPVVNGKWSLSGLSTSNGANTLSLTAVDKAKNSATHSATYNVDLVPPVVIIDDTQSVVGDETPMTVTVAGTTATYLGERTLTTLSSGNVSPVAFQRFASRYTSTDSYLPKYIFDVDDAPFAASSVTVKYRLSRVAGDASTLLVDWTLVTPVGALGDARTVFVSSALHSDLARVSGTYQIDVQAVDAVGNASAIQSWKWTQTLRPPPLGQRISTIATCPTTDPQCPGHYGLTTGKGADDLLYGGGELTPYANRVRVAQGYIDNPNDIPVRVRINPTSTRTYRWVTEYFAHAFGTQSGGGLCSTNKYAPVDILGKCTTFEKDRHDSGTLTGNLPDVIEEVRLDGKLQNPCATCATGEYELPSKKSVEVRILARAGSDLGGAYYPLTFDFLLTEGADAVDLGTPPLLGISTEREIRSCSTWTSGYTSCLQHTRYLIYHYLLFAELTPQVTASLLARPPAGTVEEVSKTAEGTNVTGFAYGTWAWSSKEDTMSPIL